MNNETITKINLDNNYNDGYKLVAGTLGFVSLGWMVGMRWEKSKKWLRWKNLSSGKRGALESDRSC